jgi:NADH-quinone oxidoreductase subunit N
MNSIIALSILALLILFLGVYKAKAAILPVTIAGLLISGVLAVAQWNAGAAPIYSGMMLFDNYAVAFSAISILGTILIILLSQDYFHKISENLAEYYAVILFSLIGILIMVSYHNLSMLFIGIEIMSVSLYILAGTNKQNFASNEAALKYFLMGAFSTGFLLFGIALLYGATATFDLSVLKQYILAHPGENNPLVYAGLMLMIIGLCFKVGAAPFHFWTPDVYEGSPTLITIFMSTVVKAAGFAAFLRLFLFCFAPLHEFWTPVLVAISIITLFIGNITAVYQHNLKRMLAYSSISHAGYLLFAIVSLGVASAGAVLTYSAAYILASIVAFAVVILVRKQRGASNFENFEGLGRTNPFMAFSLTVAMLSLAGIPLTAGFIGKFMMFSGALKEEHIWMVLIGVINAVIGIYYYFKVIISMYFKKHETQEMLAVPALYNIVLAISVLVTIAVGVYPALITDLL